MSDIVSRAAINPFPATAVVLAGLALVGFTGGAGTALLMDAAGDIEARQDASVHPATSQAGLTSTPLTAQPSSGTWSPPEPATSTAPAKAASPPSSTSTRSHPATGSTVEHRVRVATTRPGSDRSAAAGECPAVPAGARSCHRGCTATAAPPAAILSSRFPTSRSPGLRSYRSNRSRSGRYRSGDDRPAPTPPIQHPARRTTWIPSR